MPPDNSPRCPQCGSRMVLRTASRGQFAGKSFFGCTRYPACKGIVNYDPNLHGQVEQYEMTSRKPQRTVDLEVDMPATLPKVPLEFQLPIETQPKRNGLQCILLEAAGFPEIVPTLLNRMHIDSRVKRALTQWRIDYPLPTDAVISQQDWAVFSVVEKILLRGTVTLVSPTIEEIITKEILKGEKFEGSIWLDAAKRVTSYSIAPYHHEDFDSKEEAILYNEILPQLAPDCNIYAWTTPQVSASFLSRGSLEPESKQRVDFFVGHPDGTQLVIEVDGEQHNANKEADQHRDNILQNSGIKVFRVPVSEIHAKAGPQLSILEQALATIPPTEDASQLTPLELSLLLGRAASQIQIVLLQALKTGQITLSEGHKWKVVVPNPPWFQEKDIWHHLAQSAADDFIALLRAIYKIHHGSALDLTIDIVQRPNGEVDFSIQWGEQLLKEERSHVVFVISNIYLPYSFEHNLPTSPSIRTFYPNSREVEFVLNFIFRKQSFWEGQLEAISRSLMGKDSIVLLPTGGGKSIAFQLASLLMPGPCLVIDPLISLIEDQLDNLRSIGIDRAIGITSQLSFQEKNYALRSLARGHYIFFYIAPERLQMEDFREALRAVTTGSPISLVAIDEAHCVSEWGHDFRTSYLNVARNARRYCERDGIIPPLLGLTGTASRSVLKDVQRELSIEDFDAVITPRSFDRPELNFRVVKCQSSEKEARLRGYIASLPQEFQLSRNVFFQPRGEQTMAGLVFYPHVNGEMGVAGGYQVLKDEVSSVAIYSGEPPKGTPKDRWDDIKLAFAKQFKHNEITILVCTNAFGMGIDMPNIRYTVHMNLPRSIEAFYQEAGRAGRDRGRSDCCLIVSNDNPERTRRLLNPTTSLSEITLTVKEVPWQEADDITRMLYFHVHAFQGIEKEDANVRQLIAELGTIQERRTVSIEYSAETRNDREKAVHRLVILGVVEDYTNDYSHNQIHLRLSGAEKEVVLHHYLEYLRAYDHRLAEVEEAQVRNFISLEYIPFVENLAKELLEFIYSTIELGRRRSLWEMLQACTSGKIRQDILNYLQLGAHSELIASAMDRKEPMNSVLPQLIEKTASPNDAAELRGQTARLLESYPNNPALLFIRALAECLCSEFDEKIVIDNLCAAIQFSLSGTGWALPLDEVATTVAHLAEVAFRNGESFGTQVVESFLNTAHELRPAARAFIEKSSPKITYRAAEVLVSLLSDQIEDILN